MVRKFPIVFLVIAQIACSALATPEPTATVTPPPTLTATVVPTATITSTPAPQTAIINGNGFTLEVPVELDVEVKKQVVGIFDKPGTLIISLTRTPYDGSANELSDVIDEYLNGIAERGGEFIQSEPSPVMVDGVEGISVDLTGTLFDAPIEGRAIALSPEEDSVFFGMGLSNLSTDEELWQTSGSTIFQGLLDTLQFTTAQTSGECTVSTDKTYGYIETNPIKVGGDFLEGPAREEAYLDNLLGPNGESLSYEREGSIQSGEAILDIYRVKGGGLDVALYLDEYTYLPLQAPVGFTCAGEFILAP
jgi:hypothetical protein